MIDASKLLPEFLPLLSQERLNELGPGTPNAAMLSALQQLQRDLPASPNVRNRDAALGCLAGLWLHHDFLDASHILSQELHSVEGSYWHALMHRREPDYGNSKYWFRRVGAHPVVSQLVEPALALGYRYTSPFDFIDFVERVHGSGSADEERAKQVQRLEWELLFKHCYRAAILP